MKNPSPPEPPLAPMASRWWYMFLGGGSEDSRCRRTRLDEERKGDLVPDDFSPNSEYQNNCALRATVAICRENKFSYRLCLFVSLFTS